MLSKLFRSLVDQPYRYLQLNGEVYDKPAFKRFFHTAEFKTTAAGVAIVTAGMNSMPDVHALNHAFFFAGAWALYSYCQSEHLSMNKVIINSVFNGRAGVIDTKPDGAMTDPEDMISALNMRDINQKNFVARGIPMLATTASVTGLLGVVYATSESEGNLIVPALGAIFMGSLHAATGFISNVVRMNRILTGEYVILKEPPAKQEMREIEPIFSQMLPQPQR